MREALLAVTGLAVAAATARAAARGAVAGAVAAALAVAAAVGFAASGLGSAGLRTAALVAAAAVLCKVAALGRARRPLRGLRAAGHVLVWPGLDPARAFVRDAGARRGAGARRAAAGALEVVLAFGVAAAAAASGVLDAGAYPAAWARAASLLPLLDGAFRATSGLVEACGGRVEPLSRAPWAASGLADFWGRRWNLLVARTLAADVYGPVRARVGAGPAVVGTFLVSGVFHEVLFTLPTGAAPGAHTAFFVAHAVVLLAIERTPLGARPASRRAVAWATFLATAPLFFGGPYPVAAPLEHAFR